MTCSDCIHAEVCGLRAQVGEHAEQCEHFFKQIPKPHGKLIDCEEHISFLKRIEEMTGKSIMSFDLAREFIDGASTIIEAEG